MSRATISTGSFSLNDERHKQKNSNHSHDNDGCHIAILADFSGRNHRQLNDISTIKNRKIIEVDRDNFDEVFTQLDVQCRLPLAEEAMQFTELDDMHPDFIYAHVPLFNQFKVLKKKLKNSSTFNAAAEEISQWGISSSNRQPVSGADKESSVNYQGSLLDSVLSGETASPSNSQSGIQALVRDIVAPYVTAKPNPQQKELILSVDHATSSLMRTIMHHPQFQQVESAWRSLYLLVRRLETNNNLKVFIVDISEQEIIDDAAQADNFEQSQLYQLLHDKRSTVGAKPFSLVMVDAIFGEAEEGITALHTLGEVVSAMNASLITGGSPQLAGCENLGLTPDKDDWGFTPKAELYERWTQFRKTVSARHIALVAPRYLARMPYGKKTSPIDSFSYEELPDEGKHAYYLWSNGAWLVTLLIAQNYALSGVKGIVEVQEIEKLPLHVFEEDDGSCVTPCAEINMYDSAASALRDAGLLALRSILNSDRVVIPALVSTSSINARLMPSS
ncbi:MAG: type VI secretion system protein ImpC [Pseudohongiellaceae bacterium]|jgi:type VI secretion system protein ImpC